MPEPVAKRRLTVDPRQMALDFTAAPAALELVDVPAPPADAPPPPAPLPESLDAAASRIASQLVPSLGPSDVVWTQNRRTVLSSHRKDGRIVVRMNRIFAQAPRELVDAIGKYLATGDRRSSRAISRYTDTHRIAIAKARPRALDPRGAVHDLAAIFAELEQCELPGRLEGVGITWGRHGPLSPGRRRSIRLGTYSHDDHVIRIHPRLDQEWVPVFFVRFIVFHEMLHHVEPARVTEHRTEFHTPEFRARERAYADYERAIAWERANLARLLRV